MNLPQVDPEARRSESESHRHVFVCGCGRSIAEHLGGAQTQPPDPVSDWLRTRCADGGSTPICALYADYESQAADPVGLTAFTRRLNAFLGTSDVKLRRTVNGERVRVLPLTLKRAS